MGDFTQESYFGPFWDHHEACWGYLDANFYTGDPLLEAMCVVDLTLRLSFLRIANGLQEIVSGTKEHSLSW